MSDAADVPFGAVKGLLSPSTSLLAMPSEACRLRLEFALFFDGTNNNRDGDMPALSHSNVASACVANSPPGVYRSFMRVCALSLFVLLFVACSRDDDAGMFGTTVIPMDHEPSDTFVRTVYIDGHWLGSAGTGGSMVASGFSLPRRWHPGLTAVVKWERCQPYGKNCVWTEKVVPITRYEHVGGTWVHILEHDRVLIIPSMLGPGHPDYPGPDFPTKDFHQEASDRYRKEFPNG